MTALTVSEMMEAFKASPSFSEKAQRTRRNLMVAGLHLTPLHGREARSIRRADILSVADTLTHGARHAFLNNTSAIFNWALDHDLVEVNPVVRVKRPKLGQHRPVTDEEFQAIVRGCTMPVRVAAFLGRYTGQRRGDVLKMKWEDISLVHGVECIRVVQEKTGTELDIPLSETLKTAMHLFPRGDSGYIVEGEWGHRMDENQFSRRWRKECNKLGLKPDVTFHGLRKAAAIAVAENGGTVKEIMALGGWRDHRTAMGYVKGADQHRLAKSAVDKLG